VEQTFYVILIKDRSYLDHLRACMVMVCKGSFFRIDKVKKPGAGSKISRMNSKSTLLSSKGNLKKNKYTEGYSEREKNDYSTFSTHLRIESISITVRE
jgi:hypothetical protein